MGRLDSFPFERPSGLEEVVVSPLAITHYPAKRLQPPTQSSILVWGGYRLTQFVAAVFVFDTFDPPCRLQDRVGGDRRSRPRPCCRDEIGNTRPFRTFPYKRL